MEDTSCLLEMDDDNRNSQTTK